MWPLLGLFIIGLGVAPAIGVNERGDKNAPMVAWLGCSALLVLLAVVGHLQGLAMVQEAVAHASVETKHTLSAAGLSVAAFLQLAAWQLVAVLLLWSALWAAYGDSPTAAAPECWRARARIVGLLFLSALAYVQMKLVMADVLAWEATAHASAEVKPTLVRAAGMVETTWSEYQAGVLVIGGGALVGIVGMGRSLIFQGKGRIWAAALGVLLALIGAALLMVGAQEADIIAMMDANQPY